MILSIKNIEKEYDRPVLKNISYSFAAGKLYVIKGVSGCGKSTLLNILGGIETAFSGEILLDGEPFIKKTDIQQNTCGYIYQQSLLLSEITVRDNLLLIRNDMERIEALCKDLGLSSLLDKRPDELSGGERQRVAIVRALLNNPKILLADEPTASLDDGNSMKIAETIANLRSDNRIIIVATHEHCFDGLADEIIDLRYGIINNVETFHRAKESTEVSPDVISTKKVKPISSVGYNRKRGKKQLRVSAILPYALILLLIMLVSTLQNCFYDEYFSFIKDSYPVDAFNLQRGRYESAPYSEYKKNIQVYEDYRATEGEATAYYLSEQRDSVLSIDDMLEYGSFPDNENEVIVSIGYVLSMLDNTVPVGEHVGETITFCDREFTISGILYKVDRSIDFDQGARNEDFYRYLFSDSYYRYLEKTNGIFLFIPYETIKSFGTPVEDKEEIRCVYRGLFDDEASYSAIRDIASPKNAYPGSSIAENFTINVFETIVRDAQSSIDLITIIVYGILIVCFIIACIFVSSQVQIELFYRRKELGFLQIFGIKKKRVKKLVMTGYILKILYSVVFSLVMYSLCLVAYGIVTGRLILFNFIHAPLLILLIVAFYLWSVLRSTTKFLKKSTIELITA